MRAARRSSPTWPAVLLAAGGAIAAGLPAQHELLRYEVDLDAPRGERYEHVWADFLARRGVDAFAETYQPWAYFLGRSGNASAVAAMQAEWLGVLRAAHPAVVEELEAFSKALKIASPTSQALFEVPVLAWVTSGYVLSNISPKKTTDTMITPSACTSLLVRREDGSTLHGRSLDYEPRDSMAAATVVIDFRRSAEPVYRCLHPLVYPTATQWFTCVRPGAFSLSVNARSQGDWNEHNTSFPELLRRVGAPGALLLGEVAELAMQAESYEAALAVLTSASVVSSNYFILAGAHGDGAIVTRYGNASSADVWALSSASDVQDGQAPWMRVQTNVDHWVPLETGAYATVRRQHAVELIESFGPTITEDQLLQVYLTQRARRGGESRVQPEDTGVILRPSTIATLIMDPAAELGAAPDPRYWHIWSETPEILPPLDFEVVAFV